MFGQGLGNVLSLYCFNAPFEVVCSSSFHQIVTRIWDGVWSLHTTSGSNLITLPASWPYTYTYVLKHSVPLWTYKLQTNSFYFIWMKIKINSQNILTEEGVFAGKLEKLNI